MIAMQNRANNGQRKPGVEKLLFILCFFEELIFLYFEQILICSFILVTICCVSEGCAVASTMLCPKADITKVIVEKKRVMGLLNIESLIIVPFIFFLVGQTKMTIVNEREKAHVAELLNLMIGLPQVMAGNKNGHWEQGGLSVRGRNIIYPSIL